MDVHPIKNGIFIAIDPYLNEVHVSAPMCLAGLPPWNGCTRALIPSHIISFGRFRSGHFLSIHVMIFSHVCSVQLNSTQRLIHADSCCSNLFLHNIIWCQSSCGWRHRHVFPCFSYRCLLSLLPFPFSWNFRPASCGYYWYSKTSIK